MAQPILMPKPGQMTEECTVVRWHKQEGQTVVKGDILFEIETDKSNMEVESFIEGTLLKIVVKDGQTAPVQAICGFIGAAGEKAPEVVAAAPAAKQAAAAAPAAPASARPASAAAPLPYEAPPAAAAPALPAEPAFLRISPRAARLARECVIHAGRIKGRGPNGRIVERDVRAYLEAQGYARVRISPTAKQLAAKEELDVLAISGTGDGSRITVADVQRAVAEKPKPMSKMRQTIAARLTKSFTTTPHFYVTVGVDMTDLLAFRAELKAQGSLYTVTDFILEAVTLALLENPIVNSTTDGRQTWWHGQVHLGVAVALEQGLVVPVIRGAERLSLSELHDQAAALVEKARAGKLLPDEMSGGTFTVSNMGMLNVEDFGAIINPGEGAILAVASTLKQPVVRNDQVVIRQIMKLTLSVDHRLIDGAAGARFVNAVKAKLEDLNLWRRLV